MPPGPSERKSNFRGGGGRDLGIRPAQFQGLRPPTAENTARGPRGGAVFSAVGALRERSLCVYGLLLCLSLIVFSRFCRA